MQKSPRRYYYEYIKKIKSFTIPKGVSFYEVKSINGNLEKNLSKVKSDYLILTNIIGKLNDIQLSFGDLYKNCTPDSKLLIIYYNHLWEPLLSLATNLGLRKRSEPQNWLDNYDIANILDLAGFEIISKNQRFLMPIYIPMLSEIINSYIANLPIINKLCLITWVVARPRKVKITNPSVSIIIPARNEEGNMKNVFKKIPMFGRTQEVIFIEGHSKDNTWLTIETEVYKHQQTGNKLRTAKAFKQKGKGKGDAVRLGFSKATGDILMILDADLTVPPTDLIKFYNVLATGQAEFANGSRMIYPMEKQAMRTLNKIGNKTFSILFTWILGQTFKDTLCGTKVLFKKDYLLIARNRSLFGDFDPFGDYDLIFGAIKHNLQVKEIPVRYKERTYGTTNIHRFKHGLLLFQMTLKAYNTFKSW